MQIFSHRIKPKYNEREENVTTKDGIFNRHETTYSIRVVN